MPRHLSRALLAGGVVAAGVALTFPGSPAHASTLSVTRTWHAELPDTTRPIIGSSPTVATLDAGGPAVVVGDDAGNVWAYHLSDGSPVAGWPRKTADGSAVDSPPSVSGNTVFVGAGNYAAPSTGGFQFFYPDKKFDVLRPVQNIPGQQGNAAVIAGLSVGKLQGQTAVFAGSLGQNADAFTAGAAQLPGFPFFQADSNQSTAALGDLYGNGQTEIVEGGASTAGLAYGVQYVNGGHIRVISPTGGLVCNYNTNQPVSSSPAIGRFLSGGGVGIVAGTSPIQNGRTGSNWDQVLAFNSHCGEVWAATLPNEATDASPAIVNAKANGRLQIAVTGHSGITSGHTYLLDGATGAILWSTPTMGAALGGPVSVDLGGGYQDLVVAATQGVQILDGKSGAVLWSVATSSADPANKIPGMNNSALVTDDPNGQVGITIAGYNISPYDGEIVHYEVSGSAGSRVHEAGGWPEFHHDPQLTGNSGITFSCPVPASPNGYYMAASDGGIFAYGNLPFCGSTGGIQLVQPMVTMAATHDGGGYWLVARDGGVFAFGDARFHGSTGGVPLVQPIVGMAATPNGGGYWLVARDGGVFAFGNARFYGSTGGVRLVQPIVGMAATPDGGGYWLVARDGGVFSFGDAHFHGSTGGVRLNKPIVGMAAGRDNGGYWMVASDGGIFAFGDAAFHGSTGGINLNQPIVGMSATPGGGGYWLAASDGGIFAYGNAAFHGSTGGIQLAQPVVSISGL